MAPTAAVDHSGTTTGRTFAKADLIRADAAWDDGVFGYAWAPIREAASTRGILFPPNGTAEDAWDDAEPSQRAVIAQALDETPGLLRSSIARAKAATWSAVIAEVIAGRARVREQEEDELGARRDGPGRDEAAEIAAMLGLTQ